MASHANDVFRANVRQVLADRHISITDLAESAGISRPSLSRILSGSEGVTLDRAERISTALGLPLYAMIGELFPVG